MPTTYPHILHWRLLGSPLFKEKKKKKRGCTLAGAWDRAVFGCFFFQVLSSGPLFFFFFFSFLLLFLLLESTRRPTTIPTYR